MLSKRNINTDAGNDEMTKKEQVEGQEHKFSLDLKDRNPRQRIRRGGEGSRFCATKTSA